MPKTDIVSSIEFIDASQAKTLLANNAHNRPVQPAHTEALRQILRRGEWMLSNDALCIDPDGVLLNGQHRLRAIADTGIGGLFNVMWNMPRETFRIMDCGLHRSKAFATGLPSMLLADCSFLVFLAPLPLTGSEGREPKLSASQAMKIAAWWKPVWNALHRDGNGLGVKGVRTAAVRVGVGLRWVVTRDKDEAEGVIDQFQAMLAQRHPHFTQATSSLMRRIGANSLPHAKGKMQTNELQAAHVFYCMDPRRADYVPQVRHIDREVATLRDIAMRLATSPAYYARATGVQQDAAKAMIDSLDGTLIVTARRKAASAAAAEPSNEGARA